MIFDLCNKISSKFKHYKVEKIASGASKKLFFRLSNDSHSVICMDFKNENEIQELNIIENLKENITLIEWPHMIINNLQINNYFFINLEIINSRERKIKITHTHNKHFNNEF